MIRHVAILGVGLIGGSLGLAWKERRQDLHILGWDFPQVLEEALLRGAIDEAAPSLEVAAHRADTIVLSVPISAMESVLGALAPHVKPGTLITDVGSVKQRIVAAARQLLPDSVSFVGGHPMAGAEHSGLQHADAFLFENATYVLCGDPQQSAYRTIATLVESTGARIVCLAPDEHDLIAARVSHLPQLLATLLMSLVATHSSEEDSTLRLAAGGFRDMTRIASSPFDTWQPILESNRTVLLSVLDDFMATLQEAHAKITANNIDALRSAFESARTARNKIPKHFKGFLKPLCDIFVYAQDRPGTLTHITSTLFSNGINIKDIELLKIREGTGGAFRISLVDEAAADAAIDALNAVGCRAHRLA